MPTKLLLKFNKGDTMGYLVTKDLILVSNGDTTGIIKDDLDENLVDDNGYVTTRGLEIAKNAMIQLAKKVTDGRVEVISASGCVHVDNAGDMEAVGAINAKYIDAGTILVSTTSFDNLDDKDFDDLIIDLEELSHNAVVNLISGDVAEITDKVYQDALVKQVIAKLKASDVGECEQIVDVIANSLLLRERASEIKEAVCK